MMANMEKAHSFPFLVPLIRIRKNIAEIMEPAHAAGWAIEAIKETQIKT